MWVMWRWRDTEVTVCILPCRLSPVGAFLRVTPGVFRELCLGTSLVVSAGEVRPSSVQRPGMLADVPLCLGQSAPTAKKHLQKRQLCC